MPQKHFVTTPAGVGLPAMIYGTAWKQEKTSDLVRLAIETGFRAVDTACQPRHYREELVGEGIEAAISSLGLAREELYIQTKYTPVDGQDPQTVPYDPGLPLDKQVLASCEVSLKNLRSGYLDALILHSPVVPFAALIQVWRAMESLVEEGKVRQIGISNLYDLPWHQKLYEEARIKPAVIQNRFYRDTHYDKTIRAWARERGIVYQSFWSLTANPMILDSKTVRRIAEVHAKTPAQIFYAFLNSQGIVPLSGTTSLQHMQDDLAVSEIALDDEEAAAIAALFEPLKKES